MDRWGFPHFFVAWMIWWWYRGGFAVVVDDDKRWGSFPPRLPGEREASRIWRPHRRGDTQHVGSLRKVNWCDLIISLFFKTRTKLLLLLLLLHCDFSVFCYYYYAFFLVCVYGIWFNIMSSSARWLDPSYVLGYGAVLHNYPFHL